VNLEFSQNVFIKSLNTQFHGNPSIATRDVPKRVTGSMKTISGVFGIFDNKLVRS